MQDYLSRNFKGDGKIWAIIIVLFVISALAVYSASGALAYKYMSGNTTYYILKHLFFQALGLGIIYFVHRIPYKVFYGIAHILVYISIPLLFLTLAVGTSKNDAARWLQVPVIGIEFQTSDIAKFALIIMVAKLLAENQDSVDNLRKGTREIIFYVIGICGLILPANLSTTVLLFGTCLVLMFIGRVELKLLAKAVGTLIVLGILAITLLSVFDISHRASTWKNRIVNFVTSKEDDATNKADYQISQAKIAIVSGGMFGKGPGNSTQRHFLPYAYSDFIYAIIIEEYGLIGCITILVMYIFLMYRAGVILQKANRTFPAFVAIGLTINLVFQAFINMMVATGLMPVTGQSLPLVSMGGTSLLFTSVALGIILSVSRSVKENEDMIMTSEEPESPIDPDEPVVLESRLNPVVN